jgi:CopG family nickel-responsive transcriptional regulator
MKDPLVRFGVAIERSLLKQIDALAAERGSTRSELLRDLGRAAVGRAKVAHGVRAFATLTLVYDHHVRDLSERLTELQHRLGEGVRSAMHVHLSHDLCLEIVVMQGLSHELQEVADKILALRGVKQGGIEMLPIAEPDHAHDHGHAQAHDDADLHAHAHADGAVTERAAAQEHGRPAGKRQPAWARAAHTRTPTATRGPSRAQRKRN